MTETFINKTNDFILCSGDKLSIIKPEPEKDTYLLVGRINYEKLTAEDESNLAQIFHKDQTSEESIKARNKLIENNLRLATKYANKVASIRPKHFKKSLEQLSSDVLISKVFSYESDKNTKFSTYFNGYFNFGDTNEKFLKYLLLNFRDLNDSNGREIIHASKMGPLHPNHFLWHAHKKHTSNENDEKLKFKNIKIPNENLEDISDETQITENYTTTSNSFYRLNHQPFKNRFKNLGNGDDFTPQQFEDFIPDESTPSQDDEFYVRDGVETILNYIKKMPYSGIIFDKFFRGLTNKEISKKYNLSREGVRSNYLKIIKHLKKKVCNRDLLSNEECIDELISKIKSSGNYEPDEEKKDYGLPEAKTASEKNTRTKTINMLFEMGYNSLDDIDPNNFYKKSGVGNSMIDYLNNYRTPENKIKKEKGTEWGIFPKGKDKEEISMRNKVVTTFAGLKYKSVEDIDPIRVSQLRNFNEEKRKYANKYLPAHKQIPYSKIKKHSHSLKEAWDVFPRGINKNERSLRIKVVGTFTGLKYKSIEDINPIEVSALEKFDEERREYANKYLPPHKQIPLK